MWTWGACIGARVQVLLAVAQVKVGWDMKNPDHHIRTVHKSLVLRVCEVTQQSLALALFILAAYGKWPEDSVSVLFT